MSHSFNISFIYSLDMDCVWFFVENNSCHLCHFQAINLPKCLSCKQKISMPSIKRKAWALSFTVKTNWNYIYFFLSKKQFYFLVDWRVSFPLNHFWLIWIIIKALISPCQSIHVFFISFEEVLLENNSNASNQRCENKFYYKTTYEKYYHILLGFILKISSNSHNFAINLLIKRVPSFCFWI